MSTTTINEAYELGKDCAINGANAKNSHYKIFATPEHTREWERGKKDGEKELEKQKIDHRKFAAICTEYIQSPEQTFHIYFMNDSKQELAIEAHIFTRSAIMQLIGECDRQKLECYFSNSDHKELGLFVAVKG